MKKIKLKHFLLFNLLMAPAAFLASCSPSANNPYEQKLNSSIDYDLGLATEPINNLNYVRYKSVDKILPSLVDSFIKLGPDTNLKRIIKTNNFAMAMVETSQSVNQNGELSADFDDFYKLKNSLKGTNNNGYGLITRSFYEFTNFNLIGGLAKASSTSDVGRTATIYGFRNPKNTSNYMAFTGFLNNKLNRWSNGDYVSAQDLRDYFEYILDLNTGSQKLDEILKFGMRGAEKFINAQKEYLAKYNKNYINPFGRRKYVLNSYNEYVQDPEEKVWQPQIQDQNGNYVDTEDVEKIKQAALEFGFYTGQLYLDYSNETISENLALNPNFDLTKETQTFNISKNGTLQTITLVKNPFVNPYQEYTIDNEGKIKPSYNQLANSENAFTMIFDQNKTPGILFLINNIVTNIYPINRRYVETVAGGIDKYGADPKTFITTGPFLMDPSDVVLGPQGHIILTKNNEYFDAKNTISNKIKIYFSSDRNINTTFFEDGYISQTYIPATKISSYWSSPIYKNFLNKNSGYGTIAYGFNLDAETNGNSYLQDQDLRNAIYYSINRENIIKFVGWDFSFPVNTFTSYGQYKTENGKNIETYFSDLNSKTKDGVEYPLQNYDFVVHLAKNFLFEKTNREDFAYNLNTARFYMGRFKKKYPNLSKLSLRYLNNSSDEQKNAGLFLKESLQIAFGDFIDLELKNLPENTFASYIEEGKYDIIYQNYDKLGGNGAEDYVASFFKDDGINTLSQKTIGFKNNPIGSFGYTDYIVDLLLEKNNLKSNFETFQSLLQAEITKVENIINSTLASEFNQIKNQDDGTRKNNLINNFVKQYSTKLAIDLGTNFKADFVASIIEYLLLNNKNMKLARLKKAYKHFIINTMSIDDIAKATNATKERLNIQQSVSQTAISFDFWKKFIELSFAKNGESLVDYGDRLSAFFSANFTSEEVAQGWTQEYVFVFIGELEKIVRDAAFIIPLMEVDTNWEITRVAGTSSLYRFSLQYAYDYTRPPRPGLPRGRDN